MRRTSGGLAALVALFAGVLVACDTPPQSEADTGGGSTDPVASRNHGHAHQHETSGLGSSIDASLLTGRRTRLGLMTSLPIYWPLGASFEDLASGVGKRPWTGALMERRFELTPLDTLSPIAGMTSADAETDPLDGIERMAIIQPRGLSPSDNVALDDWVREGGDLLLVLDPALTGHYELALGDPRLPSVTALIPPVVARWGLQIRFDESQGEDLAFASLPNGKLALHLAGEIAALQGKGKTCTIEPGLAIARCAIGEGQATVLADAAVFEHRELAGENGEVLSALFDFAFPERDRP